MAVIYNIKKNFGDNDNIDLTSSDEEEEEPEHEVLAPIQNPVMNGRNDFRRNFIHRYFNNAEENN